MIADKLTNLSKMHLKAMPLATPRFDLPFRSIIVGFAGVKFESELINDHRKLIFETPNPTQDALQRLSCYPHCEFWRMVGFKFRI
jgi:hypothetical protein